MTDKLYTQEQLISNLRSMAEFGCYSSAAANVMRQAASMMEVMRMSMNSIAASLAEEAQ